MDVCKAHPVLVWLFPRDLRGYVTVVTGLQ